MYMYGATWGPTQLHRFINRLHTCASSGGEKSCTCRLGILGKGEGASLRRPMITGYLLCQEALRRAANNNNKGWTRGERQGLIPRTAIVRWRWPATHYHRHITRPTVPR